MSPKETDRLRHMSDAARAAVAFAAGKTRAQLDADLMFQFALIRAVEVLGEAAERLEPATRDAYPEIAWSTVIGMRNRLVHGYFDVDLDILWSTVDVDLAPLIVMLEAMLNSHTP